MPEHYGNRTIRCLLELLTRLPSTWTAGGQSHPKSGLNESGQYAILAASSPQTCSSKMRAVMVH